MNNGASRAKGHIDIPNTAILFHLIDVKLSYLICISPRLELVHHALSQIAGQYKNGAFLADFKFVENQLINNRAYTTLDKRYRISMIKNSMLPKEANNHAYIYFQDLIERYPNKNWPIELKNEIDACLWALRVEDKSYFSLKASLTYQLIKQTQEEAELSAIKAIKGANQGDIAPQTIESLKSNENAPF